jgi:two-component system NtrC family response regulator
MMAKILIAEDEQSLAGSMAELLGDCGHEVRVETVGEKVLSVFRAIEPDVVVMDVRLGGVSGLDLLREIKHESPETEVVVITAYGSVEVAVDAMKRGAAEFLTKPLDLDVLNVTIEKVLTSSQQRKRLEQFRSAQSERLRQVDLIGECEDIAAVREQVRRLSQRIVAAADLPPILLTGETGTGKDLLATYIHAALPHRSGPFVPVNCTAIPSELFESELFGHQKGAFSGATADKAGLFETADGGTLFLDEIGDLPLTLQPKLLRALETRKIRRVGENRTRSFDVCLICATNRDLEQQIGQDRFREDLFYRLNVVSFLLPPLRRRGGDVLRLAEYFCSRLATKYGIGHLRLSESAIRALHNHDWPGNVRELQHALESAALSISGHVIEADDLPFAAKDDPVRRAYRSLDKDEPINLEAIEKALLETALERTDGNVSAAARLLSIGREALRYRLSKHDIALKRDDQTS